MKLTVISQTKMAEDRSNSFVGILHNILRDRETL